MTQASDPTYKTIFDQVSGIQCTYEKLAELKALFKQEINSNRRFDAIKTLPDLLQVLEKRDFINPDNIEPLMTIAARCNQRIVLSIPNGNNNVNHNYYNMRNNVNYAGNNIRNAEYFVLPRLPSDAKERAYYLITTTIGHRWQDFARALKIPEGQIDELHRSYSKTADRTREILIYHEQICDQRKWFSTLLNALCEARRKDLRNQVQDIYDTCC